MAGKDRAQVQEPTADEADAGAQIRRRAYEISQSPDSGTPEENWDRAEREVAQRNPAAKG
jgi:hypothetical protein